MKNVLLDNIEYTIYPHLIIRVVTLIMKIRIKHLFLLKIWLDLRGMYKTYLATQIFRSNLQLQQDDHWFLQIQLVRPLKVPVDNQELIF